MNTASLASQLEPVRLALEADVAAEAAAIVEAARARADERVEAAERDADEEVAEARRRAEATGRARAERLLDRAREQAYRDELRCHRALRVDLRAAVVEAFGELRADPRYPELLDRLERVAAAQLGPSATIVRDPEPDGGVVATAGARRVDYRLPAIASRIADLVIGDPEPEGDAG